MLKLDLLPFEIPFKHPFSISRKTKTFQPVLIVRLTQGELVGLGETTDNTYYQMTVPKLMESIEEHRAFIEQYSFTDPASFWADLYPKFQDNLFALCALDLASYDLYAQQQNKKLYELWQSDTSKNPLTDYTIGIDSIKNMVQKMQEMPFPIYKIKLGTQEDLQIITELRKHTSAIFRVDANCAWSAEETIKNAILLKGLGVEFIEQPLPSDDKAGMKLVFEQSVLPIIADESCITESDVKECAGLFHGINIKLTKCGGITPALRMIAEARKLGLKIMIGSMNESTVGTSAAAHLLPLVDYADLDSPLLHAREIAQGITIHQGKISYSDKLGAGVSLKEEG